MTILSDVCRWKGKEWDAAVQQMAQWIKEGKIIADEYIEEGFENLPKAFANMLTGANIGKAVVKVAEPKMIEATM
jgi:NADPH-dependent curcumin reductase CurA